MLLRHACCWSATVILLYHSYCSDTVVLLNQSCCLPVSCYFATLMLLSAVIHPCYSLTALLLSSDFTSVTYCFTTGYLAGVNFLDALMVLCHSWCCLVIVIVFCQSYCQPFSWYCITVTLYSLLSVHFATATLLWSCHLGTVHVA